MKSICFIIPYFGKLPANFDLWLLSCGANSTVNYLIYTDDRRAFKYPDNVKVKYIEFALLKNQIQSHYDFSLSFETPWRLALMKPAYGEIFEDDIDGYDFWGYCDIDMMWGNIRKFYTDDILEKYDRIGFQGHCTLMRNTPENNRRYRFDVPSKLSFKDVFCGNSRFSFDENGMDDIFDSLSLDYFKEINFAHLRKFDTGFFLGHMPTLDARNNKYQMFTWVNGTLLRYYLYENQNIKEQEFLYIHFFCRPMKYAIKKLSLDTTYTIYPDVMTDKHIDITRQNIIKYGTRNRIGFLVNMLWANRHKITWNRIVFNTKKLLKL